MDKFDLGKRVEALIMNVSPESLAFTEEVRGKNTGGFRFNFGEIQAFLYFKHDRAGDNGTYFEVRSHNITLYLEEVWERSKIFTKWREYNVYQQKSEQEEQIRKKNKERAEEERRLSKAERLLDKYEKNLR